jgi:Flp pilus assembly protein TadD
MTQLAVKLAVSTLVLGGTMVGCSLDRQVYGVAWAAAKSSRAAEGAGQLFEQAHAALQRGDHQAALPLAERAVELAPRDAGYRMLLADLYIKNGRFASAEASYRDVLELQPDHGRAALTLALAQIAQGKNGAALGRLDQLAGSAPAADLGLAYTLAGQPERGIELLEPAARAEGANGRVRQNLAYAYAMAGDWHRARTVAAQDVSPNELASRMQHWASMARPQATWTQVASLLNVTPSDDPGQPVRLALAPAVPEPQPALYVEAEPELVVFPDEPVRFASIDPIPAPFATQRSAEAVEPAVAEFQYAAAAEALVRAESALAAPPEAPTVELPKPIVERLAPRQAPVVRAATSGVHSPQQTEHRFVVQIGAFSNVGNAQRAWSDAERRYGVAQAQGVTTTIDLNGRTLHRVAIGGFDSPSAAAQTCRSIKAKGGACFVRGIAGDAPVQLAWRNIGRA